ncbi:hypothetical protein PFX98_00815 [Paucibacter sediminis]|uniref:Uncharacterized protein n=1 Tax=Paucibacter sediminis TaxID=3019553 RepID=A0AA95NBV3_9BURK|nr:hypothetical protein [Paucibacter sp. S2-9]WIT12177.1 hypothetical protein PFX98_00815 [Paucibacter sp. S2-9]
MILNLNDPASILAWWQVLPQRHGSQLLAMARLRPQFAAPIQAALRRIRADATLNAQFERGLTDAALLPMRPAGHWQTAADEDRAETSECQAEAVH